MKALALITAAMISLIVLMLPQDSNDRVRVTLQIVDQETREAVPGLVRIRESEGKGVQCLELLSRGAGLKDPALAEETSKIHEWLVLPRATEVDLPAKQVHLEAFSGLETEMAELEIDFRKQQPRVVELPVKRFAEMKRKGWRSANTHLHLMKLNREEANRYLSEIPRADRLDMLFVSYLERTGADQDYITNRFSRENLKTLSGKSGVLFGNGEEHRHNFEGYGEGFGHVMFLNIPELIQPVSIGPGIMKTGTDGIPLQRGIDAARRSLGTVVWCHNGWGRENLPNLLNGRVDAQNIFDGSLISSYKESFYPQLNLGLRVPFSTGTDWFMYDLSRVYVQLPGELSVGGWLEALSQGRSVITNGPLLELRVTKGKDEVAEIGDTIQISKPTVLQVEASGRGRIDFERLEIVQNGRVVRSERTRSAGKYFEAEMEFELEVGEPGWLTVRTPPPPVANDPELQTPVARNEFGRWIFAHSSPIFVEFQGRRRFECEVAERFLSKMEKDREEISRIGTFADDQERARVLDVYEEGIRLLKERIAEAGVRAAR